MPYYGRTDLAEEAHRQWLSQSGNPTSLPGVRVGEELLLGLPVTAVEILNEEGEQTLGKARGRYYHLRLPAVFPSQGEAFEEAVRALAVLICRCLPSPAPRSALVAALGNPDVTPDALGPLCAESVLVTRHLQKDPMFQRFIPVSLCRTGVLGTSGMESAFQIQTLSRALQPDCVLAVDALAGLDPEELCRCVQVCDAGIAPGSGVGNNREMLSRETLGVPVLALGVPTVIDAASLSGEDGLSSLFVTPRWIDSAVRQYARLLGYAINAALQPGLAVADMDLLLT